MKNDTLKGLCTLVVTYVTLLVFSVSFVNADVLIDIDLTDDELGELKSIPNTGTLGGTFEAEVDTPSVTEVDGVKAVTLDGANDWYVGPDSAPLTGDADRTVEAWVFNPDIPGEETIVAWGRRGGGDGTNWSMNYGNHNTWGALGGWGGSADMAFVAGQTGGPEAGKWHHLTLSYDKSSNTRSIYVDGFLSNSENDGNPLNTWAVANDNETPLPIVIGNQNEANGTRVDNLSGSLSIAKLKIHDTALSGDDVFNSFDNDRTTFGLGGPLVSSFSSSSSSIVSGDSATLTWNTVGADSLSIDNGIGDVSGTTSVSVSPSESTTYTLTAADAGGIQKTASVTVNVTLPSPSSAVVIHQWKFEEEGGAGTTLVDSVGSADGTIVDVGGNDGTVGGGSVTLAGGPKDQSDYVKLPSGLVSSLSSTSIETWVTQKSAQNWSRVFSVGSASNNVMHMSFTKGGNLNENEWRWNAQSNLTLGNFGGQPTNPIDEQVHWVVTVDDTGGAGDKTKVTIYKNGEEVSTGETDNNLSGLNDRDFFLGRSQWGDNAANASWDEFRIYNGALTAEQVATNNTAGPDGDPPAAPPTYSNDFNEYADGTTDLGDGTTIFGQAARVLGGRLQLTRDGEGLGFSSFTVPAMEGTSKGFTATFDYELFDSTGSNPPADGFSFNYGNAPVGDQGQAEEGMAGRPGVTENLSFEVDTWQNFDAEQGVNISGLVDGEDVGQLAFTNGPILEDGSRKTGSMEIRWDPSNGATFYSTGLTTNAEFTDVDTGAFVGDDGYNFIISARVGGANQDLFIDNLIIVAGKPTPAPLPAVTAYYDFEGHEGNTVADKGANGLGAEINRGDQLTIGGSGAPKGSTPGTGIDLQGGFLNVAGADLTGIIQDVEGQNSYTMSAWIKPSDINGDKFLFGQTSQGIHNGIRGGGFLHQAHWGADNNGATNLSTLDGEWVHAAWTYDGAADVGKIYLNGELDAEVSKRAPNGNGNLIIGGRNGGESGYRGMADDIAVWNQVLDARQIKALAGGQSPINAEPADDDEDGIPDGFELALVGNTTDLGGDAVGKSLGVSFNSNRGNAEATMDADTVAGVVPSTGWISTNGDTDGASGSISNGGLNIDWSSNGTWNTNNGGGNGDNKLMNGYIDAIGGEGASQVALSGINAEFADGYDLYVYFGSDGNNRTGKVQLVDGATYSFNTFSQQGGDFPAQYTRTTDEGDANPQANYALYEGLSGDSQTLNIIRGSNNSGFHGIQIVSPGDYDGDGLSDLAEYEGVTSPIVADGDEDGLSDGAEIAAGTNPNKSDTDGDGLADGAEIVGGTDPTKADTDDDGYTDGAEIAKGSDPTDAASFPGLPTPIAFYDFEEKSSTAVDRSFNENLATVSGDITFVDGGAPEGSTPGAAASMNGGHFRVPGIDMNSQIRDSGDGSYSMVAWIKPDSLEGERFIFGQTDQGIHNGIRNNAFLHQAHWGADTNGTTNLNTLGLLPLQSSSNYPAGEAPAKAIDGDVGSKYLNFAKTETGIIVTPQTASTVASISLTTANDDVRRDPASFILYGTNEAIASADNSMGDAEAWTEIASGDLALSDDRAALSVVNIENSSEYASYKLLFPTVKDAATNSMQIAEIQFHTEADAGGDNILSPADAVLAVHSPTPGENADEDGWIHAAFVYDGANDIGRIYLNGVLDWEGGKRAANGGGHLIIGGRSNGERNYTGLIDDVAIWDEALAGAEVAELAAGGSPISSLTDSDGDGFADVWENTYAGNLTDLGAGVYSQTFTGPDGSTDLGDGSVIFGAAASLQDNALRLTIDGQALGFSSFSVPGIAGSSSGWTATFDYELFDSAGNNNPADGFSFNYGNAPLGDQGQAEEGMAGRPGVTENISFEVDTWQNFDSEQGVNISGVVGGVDAGQFAFNNGPILEDGSTKTGKMSLGWNPSTGADFVTTGLTTNADFAEVQTGEFQANDDHTFNISARVGGANQTLIIDNLVIRVGESDFDEDGLSDLAEYISGASNPAKADSDDDGLLDGEEVTAGTQPLVADTDGDGLNDGAEISAGTNPLNSDSDDDGYADGAEVKAGSDPTDSNSTPPSLLAYYDFEAPSGASITSIEEEGIGGDEPAIIANDFNEDSLTFSDRTHQHNGAAFNAEGLLDANGETIVGLPDYLVGGDYIRFANNARDNNPYTATVTADKATSWYLLVDNRLDGVAGNRDSSNTTDPVIGGTLQWITDNGWQRVNTGISPNGQADYTGVDEGGDGEGAGQGLNQFYAVYTLDSEKVSVLIPGQGIGGSNMLSLVAKTQTSSTVVADKGAWGNDATVVRPEQTVVGIEGGAPNGPSPGTAADFQGGYLNVPGVDMSKVISGEGSYTFAAWIKPSDLGGNKFLFGQTQQGIHNGIRNGGYLHQAHWGADTNGATNLNDYDASANDGWVHAAWVYDGATDTGKIYLDGVEDYSGDKRAPNGSGNLIVGGSNGGGDNFRGLVDEVAVWDIAAPADVIAALAAGTSPLDLGSSAPSTFDVTSFSYNVGTGDLSIGWKSDAGKSYGLEYSVDLKTWVDLEVTVDADADAATYSLPGAQNPLVGERNVFLRVYEK